MNELLEILKYTVPAIIVLLASYLTMKIYLRNEEKRRKFELSLNQKETTLPLQLQAYERLVLLLERISPDSVVMRTNTASQNAAQVQNELITSVRTEFEHNLAQQIYISNRVWESVKTARTEMIKLINSAAAEIRPSDPGVNLSKRILEKAMELDQSPTTEATLLLKKEVQELM